VGDTGPGLDPATSDRIFEPMFTTKPNGMGMGLAICRSIIEAHRGRLWASPCLPHGAIVRFTVPFSAADGAQTFPGLESRSGRASDMGDVLAVSTPPQYIETSPLPWARND